MRNRIVWIMTTVMAAILLAACGVLPTGGGGQGATTGEIGSPDLPKVLVVFKLHPPAGTPADAAVHLDAVDVVTGVPYDVSGHAMTRQDDGTWRVQLDITRGALFHYRYSLAGPNQAVESSPTGQPIRYRVAAVSGAMEIDDVVAGWGTQKSPGSTGRIMGQITSAADGSPLTQVAVSAGGLSTFTDGEGRYRLEGLPEGVHNLVAYTTDGSYLAVQHGAAVAGDSTTPADLQMTPAKSVQATFELTVPQDTAQGTPIRMAGDLKQFGDVFSELPGGLDLTASRMPQLVSVDATHYILLAQLYEGTDLHYKYTLGDGLWNAERNSDGSFRLRELIVPDHDFTVQDTVVSWHSGSRARIPFNVTVPSDTPAGDNVSIQINPFTWFEPMPMWKSGSNQWLFVLEGPLDFSGNVTYRYCRNDQCGIADDADTAGSQATGRTLNTNQSGATIEDQVTAWQWWNGAPPSASVMAPAIQAVPGIQVGVQILPDYRPNWSAFRSQSVAGIKAFDANSVILTPTWTMGANNPLPIFAFDPGHGPFNDDLQATASEATRQGLGVVLRPTLRAFNSTTDDWWNTAPRDTAWWTTWFDTYRSFVLSYAQMAQAIHADTLVLGGPEAAPALPSGVTPDGQPSGVPGDADARWRSLIQEVRGIYQGKIAFEIEDGKDLQPIPGFADAVDQIQVYWHVPLTDQNNADMATLQAGASQALDHLLQTSGLNGKPVSLSVEYLSITNSASACAPAPDETCRPNAAFDEGAVVDPDLAVNLDAQAQAFNAMLLEASKRPEITGFYARGYNPIVALQDKSASVNGKPARDVLWYWYPRLTGQTTGQ